MDRHKFGVENSRHPWLITFADLLMVILVLFILMYSYSYPDQKKFESMMDSIQGHQEEGRMPIDPDGQSPGKTGSGILDDGNEGDKTVPKEYENQLAEMIEREEKIKEVLDYVHTYAREHQLEDKMTVTPTKRGIEVVLPEIMLFPSGQANLIEEAILFLDDMAPLLSEISNLIELEGHTDNRPISTERFPSNWDLSSARSNEVIRYLIEKKGLPPERFKSIGYGEYHPIASNDTEEGRGKNRRVVLIITNQDRR